MRYLGILAGKVRTCPKGTFGNVALCNDSRPSSPQCNTANAACNRYCQLARTTGLNFRSSSTIAAPAFSSTTKGDTLDFDDYSRAFQSKSNKDLVRALGILYLCSSDTLVRNSLSLLNTSRRVLGQRLFHAVVKPTLYKQFVGGDNRELITEAVRKLMEDGVGPMLMLPMEEDVGESDKLGSRYDRNLQVMLDSLQLAKGFGDDNPMLQIKLTALLSGTLCQKLSECCPEPALDSKEIKQFGVALQTGKDLPNLKGLTKDELTELNKALQRIRTLCTQAKILGILLLVDAEYTYINPALNLIALGMMCYCNENRPLVMYTYQNYLKATHDRLCRDVDFALSNGVCFGSKLVRGAYMDKERKLAKEKCYPDPVCDTFEDTTDTYNRSMDTMLRHISTGNGRVATVIASHNEDTVHTAVQRMQNYNIDPKNNYVFFAQVYGMGDFLSVILGQSSYRVYKSIPYGIPEDTLPYLSRRVTENRAVLDGARRERILLLAELKDRLGRKRRHIVD